MVVTLLLVLLIEVVWDWWVSISKFRIWCCCRQQSCVLQQKYKYNGKEKSSKTKFEEKLNTLTLTHMVFPFYEPKNGPYCWEGGLWNWNYHYHCIFSIFIFVIKRNSATRFLASGFLHKSNPPGPLTNRLKCFYNQVWLCQFMSCAKKNWLPGVENTGETNKNC